MYKLELPQSLLMECPPPDRAAYAVPAGWQPRYEDAWLVHYADDLRMALDNCNGDKAALRKVVTDGHK